MWPKSGGKSCSFRMSNVLLSWISWDGGDWVKDLLYFLGLQTLIHFSCGCSVELMDAFGLSPCWIYRSMGTVGEVICAALPRLLLPVHRIWGCPWSFLSPWVWYRVKILHSSSLTLTSGLRWVWISQTEVMSGSRSGYSCCRETKQLQRIMTVEEVINTS